MDESMELLQYPTGRFNWPKEVSDAEIEQAIETIAGFPVQIRKVVEILKPEQLDTPYRPDGWTVRQVVHHCADSHMNAYIRFKLALTEDNPVIKPYDQARWAMLVDSKVIAPETSLNLIKGVHERWVMIMDNMNPEEWERGFVHPEYNVSQTLGQAVMMYRWHCGHHLAHITRLAERMGW